MARQPIDIGSQGNDGTGDSIREAFRKVNENLNELYAVFGAGGSIKFTDLSDTPNQLYAHQILVTNDLGNGEADIVEGRTLIQGAGIEFTYGTTNSIPSLTITSTATTIASDTAPVLGGPLNANGFPIANIATPSELSLQRWQQEHGIAITQDDLVINKGYADKRYIQQTGGGSTAGTIRIRSEPANANNYTKTINSYVGGNVVIVAHGYDSGSDGIAFKYQSTGTGATNLVLGNTYYLKYVSSSQLSMHPTANDAKAGTNKISVSGGSGTQTLTDAFYDPTLSGYFLSNEAMPRTSVVRRQGDTMTGALVLNDHPGALAGSGTPNGADDLQAATKYYVDNSSFASQVNLFVTTTGDDAQTITPTGKEGRAFAYAYATVGAACNKASELIDLSLQEPGPYRQKITYTVGTITYESLLQTVGFSGGSGYTGVQDTLNANREYIREEVVSYIDYQVSTGSSPFTKNFVYKRDICSRDIGIIIDAIIIDTLVSGNYQSINAGKAYYKNASALTASGIQQLQTVAGVNYAKYLVGRILQGFAPAVSYQSIYTRKAVVGTVDSTARAFVASSFDIVTGIISNGIYSGPVRHYGTGVVSITMSNGNVGFVDQGNTSNVDIIPGKLVRGIYSGAIAKIVSYSGGATFDTITGYLLTPYNFQVGEAVEFAEPNKNLQITIRLESGVYYEDLPIKIPANVTVKGDEFRRTIIRPRDRVSQSALVQTYFYRDKFYDGLRLTAYTSANQAIAATVTPSRVSSISVITLGSGSVSTAWFGQFFKADQGAGNIPAEGVVTSVYMGTYNANTTYYVGQIVNYASSNWKVQAIVKGVTPSVSTFYTPYTGLITSTSVFEVTLFSIFSSTATVASGSWYIYQTTNYGYHYLQDPTRVLDVGANYVNAGKYVKSAKLLDINRSYMQAEIVGYLSTEPATSATWAALSTIEKTTWARDFGSVIDSVISDLKAGGKAGCVNAAVTYLGGSVASNQNTAKLAGVNYVNTLAQKIILNDPPTTTYQTTVTQVFNNIDGESASTSIITNLVGTVAYAFNTAYNPPKNNKEIDMFFFNDAIKVHNLTGQGHGGFMCVLDPNGLVGSKSPYVQSCSSLSGSTNKQRFAGGMFIDGFVGRLPGTITDTTDAGKKITVGGLFKREPLAPTAFYRAGFRYQVDNVSEWDPVTGVAKLDLNPTTPWSGGNLDIILETPGNRSMLANDFTQVNDLGYGVVAHNTGLTEQVSTFTYYCHTAYMASNGGQIRSVAGSNAHGNYGLRSVGSDPTEAPDQVYLQNNLVQVAQIYKHATVSNVGLSGQIQGYIKNYTYIPTSTSELEISTTAGPVRYEVRGAETTGLYQNDYTLRITAVSKASSCVVTTVGGASITAATQANPVVITSVGHPYLDGDLIKITDVVGMTQLNKKSYYVKYINSSTFSLYKDISLVNSVDASGYTQYISGGNITYPVTFHSGERVTFAAVGGMTELNSNLYYVKPLTATTFGLYSDKALASPVNSSGYTTYTSGGTVTNQIYYSINGATKASPCTVSTTVAHSFSDGDLVFIAGVTGMTDINTTFYVKVSGLTSTQVQLYKDSTLATPISTTAYATYISGGTIVGGKEVLKLNLSTAANDNRVSSGFTEDLFEDEHVIIRALQNFKVYDVANVAPTRPSTALEFVDTLDNTNGGELYRVIAYNLVESTGPALGSNIAILTVDTSFLYVRPLILASKITTTDPIDPTKKMGSQIGDIRLAIDPDSINIDGIRACNSNRWVFGHVGKLFRIVSYTPVNGAVPAYITIADELDNNNIPSAPGISAVFSTSSGTTLRAGLPASSQGQVTIKISTCRATGHDFLDIGTGGYNTTNYPYAIFGNPAKVAVRENQVKEETKGRVFYAATDQDGIFTVGRYFKVDQGTGTVTFSASIALSNLDGLGFKRGVVVSEFSTDNSMTNNASDTVPTQSAIRGYIDRRLGLTHVGTSTALLDLIGPGYMPLSGTLTMKGVMNLGSYRITNVGSPFDLSDAANKNYVDSIVNSNNQLSFQRDVKITSPSYASVLAFTGNQTATIDAGITGDISTSFTGTVKSTLVGGITAPPDTDSGIISSSQSAVSGGIVVTDITGFPSSGYLLIGGEIFFYSSTTVISNRFDSVVRAQNTTTGAVYAAGVDVIWLDTAQLNLQINPEVIVNADISATAAIAQSKLSLVNATAAATSGAATKGIASFDSTFFTATSGYVSLANTSIGLGKLSNIANGTVLANLSGAGASPTATAASDVLKTGLDQSFSTTGVVTFTKGLTTNSYAITPVSTSNIGNSIVKTDEAGQINVTSLLLNGNTIVGYSGSNLNIKTPGGFTIIDAAGGAEASTAVILYGQYTLGAASSLVASSATNATNATNAGFLNVSGNYRSASTSATANSIAARDASGNLTATIFNGALSGNASTATSATTAGTAGNATNADNLKVGTSYQVASTAATTSTIAARSSTDYTDPSTGVTYTAGSLYANYFVGTATSALFADLAEFYLADKKYEPGTVLVFGGDKEITTTTIFGDTRVAGIVSTNPAYIMNAEIQGDGEKVCVALQGRVPCKVVGTVKKGDLLTTSAIPGHAVRAIDPRLGTIIGKALQDKNTSEAGVIEVSVGRT